MTKLKYFINGALTDKEYTRRNDMQKVFSEYGNYCVTLWGNFKPIMFYVTNMDNHKYKPIVLMEDDLVYSVKKVYQNECHMSIGIDIDYMISNEEELQRFLKEME